ncbi:LysR family transcriptional regulator [Ktedonobacter robiniae]|uniref:LysR family transcriptional regulator n=1 Tax=Ktedonobacter robiniae TaxID=2778365 RepID=A0ABQ3UQC8_9CHLR|nr:LysR family transcriptional regulator [Ktedonobacter robiniae]GHO54894.1 LysR family transcriptional regulator [Ktedonobacter robiniae]
MDYEQLLTFERIVREGSFSKAARSLNIAQPTISARIQALEAAVGGALFRRGGRSVSLTERGASFLPYAQQALTILAEGVETARLTQSGQRGRVTLATMQSLSGSFLGSAIASFYRAHPQVDLAVHIAHSHEIIAMLIDGIVKLGLIGYPFHNHNLRILLRLRESLDLILPVTHPLASQKEVTIEQLQRAGSPFLFAKWNASIDMLMQQVAVPGQPMLEVPFNAARHLLLEGIGIAFLTRASVEEELRTERLVSMRVSDGPALYRESALVCLAHDEPPSAAVRDFVRTLTAEAANSSAFSAIHQDKKLWSEA